jgi:hypothetical protein
MSTSSNNIGLNRIHHIKCKLDLSLQDLMLDTMMLDPAVLRLLSLDSSTTSVSSAGGGGCSSAQTFKITTKLADGTEKRFFMKTGSGKDSEVMFEGIMFQHYLFPP